MFVYLKYGNNKKQLGALAINGQKVGRKAGGGTDHAINICVLRYQLCYPAARACCD